MVMLSVLIIVVIVLIIIFAEEQLVFLLAGATTSADSEASGAFSSGVVFASAGCGAFVTLFLCFFWLTSFFGNFSSFLYRNFSLRSLYFLSGLFTGASGLAVSSVVFTTSALAAGFLPLFLGCAAPSFPASFPLSCGPR